MDDEEESVHESMPELEPKQIDFEADDEDFSFVEFVQRESDSALLDLDLQPEQDGAAELNFNCGCLGFSLGLWFPLALCFRGVFCFTGTYIL